MRVRVMARPKLTPHQANTLGALQTFSRGYGRRASGCDHVAGWVPLSAIGSKGGLNKLVAKGYAERMETSGPRGGARYWYRPTSSD